MTGLKITIRGLAKNWSLKRRARKTIKPFVVTSCGRDGVDIMIQIQPEDGDGLLTIRFDQANVEAICEKLRELDSEPRYRAIGYIPSAWLAAARTNESEDSRLENWIETALNVSTAHVYDDGSVWVGGPRGGWLKADEIDDLMKRIDKGV